jgi:hypothetical protein
MAKLSDFTENVQNQIVTQANETGIPVQYLIDNYYS